MVMWSRIVMQKVSFLTFFCRYVVWGLQGSMVPYQINPHSFWQKFCVLKNCEPDFSLLKNPREFRWWYSYLSHNEPPIQSNNNVYVEPLSLMWKLADFSLYLHNNDQFSCDSPETDFSVIQYLNDTPSSSLTNILLPSNYHFV